MTMDVDIEKQATTFGAIIERRSPPAPTSLPSGMAPQTPPTRPAPLHSNPSSNPVEAPQPSPYASKDSLALDRTQTNVAPPRSEKQAAAQHLTVDTTHPAILSTPASAKSKISVASHDAPSSTTPVAKGTATVTTKESSVWPSLAELKRRAKKDKAARSCNPMLRLSKRTRFIVSVVIALVIIGAAIGIGVGVSRATNGEVWAGQGKSRPIAGS